jgi:N-acetylmuramoyl-L-alanine amidase
VTIDPLPIETGSAGGQVRDVQERLRQVGFPVPENEDGRFEHATGAAIRRFQADRGLRVDGSCGPQTWSSLVEAGYELGDRFLYLRSPMQRGEDVADLQERLGSLGFDAGRVDGIFGPDTGSALEEFQRNCGLTADGICGPDTIASLARLASRQAGPTSVAHVREMERLRGDAGDLPGHRVVIGHGGDSGILADGLARILREAGAEVTVINHPDGSAHADEANRQTAHLYVGLRLVADVTEARLAFYAQRNWESVGGHRLADLVAAHLQLGIIPDLVPTPEGMRLPVLRETRMPAISCELGPADQIVPQAPAVVRAMADAVMEWIAEPVNR